MKSRTPKVLHEVGGRSLVGHVVHLAHGLRPERIVVVVGHGRDRVIEQVGLIDPDVVTVVQEQQLGTGHAVRIALEAVTDADADGAVLVVSGDSPLVTTATLTALLDDHTLQQRAATLLTAHVDDPTGYGRIVRDADGAVARIVEQKDADSAQLAITEVNSGMYAFALGPLRDALGLLTTDNAQQEEYLTDVVAHLREASLGVGGVVAADATEILGVNDRVQLAQAGAILRDRRNEQLMRAGVTIVDPATTWIDVDVDVAPDAVLQPGTVLRGATSIGADAVIGPNVTLVDTEVGEGATVREATCELAVIGARASVGPYTYLRPGTVLGVDAKAGGFVEMKNAVVGDGSKVPHLSYVGDAEIGRGSNIGAATVFVNYDGAEKHRTVVGDAVRIGSDTMLVAPVEVGDGAYTAAGSVITDDVPPGAMAVGRARQRNIHGWTERKRPGSASAEAAAEAREHDDAD
jgi:bifunctional UDP-N-acetylglucosamine pyrophosphorylase/glucosamine-1-phosphate N-acetyltransferase